LRQQLWRPAPVEMATVGAAAVVMVGTAEAVALDMTAVEMAAWERDPGRKKEH